MDHTAGFLRRPPYPRAVVLTCGLVRRELQDRRSDRAAPLRPDGVMGRPSSAFRPGSLELFAYPVTGAVMRCLGKMLL